MGRGNEGEDTVSDARRKQQYMDGTGIRLPLGVRKDRSAAETYFVKAKEREARECDGSIDERRKNL